MANETRLQALFSDLDTLPIPEPSGWVPAYRPSRFDPRARSGHPFGIAGIAGFVRQRERPRSDTNSEQWIAASDGAIAIPRVSRRGRVPIWALVAAVIVLVALYGPALVQLSGFGSQMEPIRAPSVRISIASTSLEAAGSLNGVVLVHTQSPARIQTLSIAVYPIDARRPGVDEASVRVRLIAIPLGTRMAADSNTQISFTWNGRRDDGTAAAPGEYVMTVTITSQIDSGNSHATMTSLGNEVMVIVR